MKSVDKKFYVLRTFSGKEKKVEEMLNKEIGDENGANVKSPFYGRLFRAIVPMKKEVKKNNKTGKMEAKDKPSMPGYVLIEAIMTNELREDLRLLPDVMGFLGNMNPEALSTADAYRMLRKADFQTENEDSIYEIEYLVGDNVRIVDGAFSGHSGIVDEVNKNKKELKVIVKMFGRNSLLELGYAEVEKV